MTPQDSLEGRLSLASVEAAARLIDPVFLRTPQFVCEPIGSALGVRLAIKVETMNPIRCFKGRGAEFLLSRIAQGTSLVCASAGNFGQAMAYSCRKRGIPLVVYAAVNANPLKVDRMRALGADVRRHGEDFDAAKVEARRAAVRSGARFVEDGRDPEIAEGAGTIGLEWLTFPEALDDLLVPLGNGALLAGLALVFKKGSPRTRIVAVQAAGAPAMVESWRTGRVVRHDRTDTIADGIAVRVPIPEALDEIRGRIDDALLVGESEIAEAMRVLHRQAGVVAEPAGAVGVAALLQHAGLFRGRTVGTIVCGSNLNPDHVRLWS